MPVWHEATEAYRASEELVVIGITQEQHPERCALFAQWQEFEWPILWDPLNLTESQVVPRFFGIDEHGVVRADRPRPDTFVAEFLDPDFESPLAPGADSAEAAAAAPAVRAALIAPAPADRADDLDTACAELLFGDGADLALAIDRFERLAKAPEDHFRLGVAYRMRADSEAAEPGDFQRAIERWAEALAQRPNQYIWRRRLQQYGPRLDKPYPFYDWVERAQAEVAARGLEPVPLGAPLSASETAQALRAFEAAAGADEPDAEGQIDRDGGRLVEVETAVTFHTGEAAGARPARVHLALRPVKAAKAHWNNEAGDLAVWVDLPDGWQADRQLLSFPNPAGAVDAAVRRLDFEVHPAPGASGAVELEAYALFYACEDADGQCVYRRRDFKIPIDLR